MCGDGENIWKTKNVPWDPQLYEHKKKNNFRDMNFSDHFPNPFSPKSNPSAAYYAINIFTTKYCQTVVAFPGCSGVVLLSQKEALALAAWSVTSCLTGILTPQNTSCLRVDSHTRKLKKCVRVGESELVSKRVSERKRAFMPMIQAQLLGQQVQQCTVGALAKLNEERSCCRGKRLSGLQCKSLSK